MACDCDSVSHYRHLYQLALVERDMYLAVATELWGFIKKWAGPILIAAFGGGGAVRHFLPKVRRNK